MGTPEGTPKPALNLQDLLALAGVFAAGNPPRVVPALADLRESVAAPDLLVVKDGARIRGNVEAPRVVLGHRVRIDGLLRAGSLRAGRELAVRGRLEVAGRAVFQGGVHVSAPEPGPEGGLVLAGVRIDVPTRQADRLLAAFRAVGWGARDTGRTVSTDEEEDGLTTLLVDVRVPAGRPDVEAQTQAPPPAPPPPAPRPATPYLRGALLAQGDLLVGEGIEMDLDLSATGDVTILPGAMLGGRVRAGGDLFLGEGAVVGDASCGGRLHLAADARVTGSVEADGGLAPGSRVRL